MEKEWNCCFFRWPDHIENPVQILGPLASFVCFSAKHLNVKSDSSFKLNKQETSVVKTSFTQFQLLAKVQPFLSTEDSQSCIERTIYMLVYNGHALVGSSSMWC